MGGKQLRIFTLGRTRIESGEGPMGGEWLAHRPGELLKYLVTERGRLVPLEELVDVFWPHAGRGGATNVRQAVHSLRERLEPRRIKHAPSAFVAAAKGGYELDQENVWIDAEELEASARAGLEALRRAAEDPGDPEELCDQLVASMLAIHPANDDIAVLALRGLSAEAEKLHLDVSTDPTLLGGVRRELARWLRAAGARQEEIELMQMACHEACSNAIEHGYGFGEGRFSIDAWVEADTVILEVHDDGRWIDRGGQTLPYRGHGLPLIEKVMEAVELSRGDDGTTVRMERRLARDREPAPS